MNDMAERKEPFLEHYKNQVQEQPDEAPANETIEGFHAWEQAVRSFLQKGKDNINRLEAIGRERRHYADQLSRKERALKDLWEPVQTEIRKRLTMLPDVQREAIQQQFPDTDLAPESLEAFFYWQEQQVRPRSILGIHLDRPLRELQAYENNPLVRQTIEAVELLRTLRETTKKMDVELAREDERIRQSFENGAGFDVDTLMLSETFLRNSTTASRAKSDVYSLRVGTVLIANDLYDSRSLEENRATLETGTNAFLRVYSLALRLSNKYGI